MALPLNWGLQPENPLFLIERQKVHVGCEPAAIKVSLRAVPQASAWQEPPEKQYKDGRVFMETSEVHGESHPWWN